MFGVWCLVYVFVYLVCDGFVSVCVCLCLSLLWLLYGWGSYIFGHLSSSTGTEDALLPKLQVCTQHSPRYVFRERTK